MQPTLCRSKSVAGGLSKSRTAHPAKVQPDPSHAPTTKDIRLREPRRAAEPADRPPANAAPWQLANRCQLVANLCQPDISSPLGHRGGRSAVPDDGRVGRGLTWSG